jgi:hypothetical protein
MTIPSSQGALWQAVSDPQIDTEKENPSYSTDFAPNDLLLFSKRKSALKGQIFKDIEDIHNNVMTALKAIS